MTSGADGATAPTSLTRQLPAGRELEELRRVVLHAADRLWRDLPWRATRDPWHVLVSEVMLQQTQATRVVAPYRRFVARFPSAATCAAASPADVVRAWAGLGYNRRALHLHRTAIAIVDRHRGRVPDELDLLLELPGVGPYTARAVLAFAHGLPVGVVDTNVSRVLARAVAGRPLTSRAAQQLADRLVDAHEAWRFNQALFDLGARCCTARAPRCGTCPLRSHCAWRRGGNVPPDPAGARRRQAAFAGSDREGRGRLVGALRLAPVPVPELAVATGWPDDERRSQRIADALVDEGLACWRDGALALALA
jgi:A/G-specific adenine glycosylase